MPIGLTPFTMLDSGRMAELRGTSLKVMLKAPERIPEACGIYIWRYWPTFDELPETGIRDALRAWQEAQPTIDEVIRSSRTEVTLSRRPLGSPTHGLFGLGPEKEQLLLDTLESSHVARDALLAMLQCVVALAPPLYVGKADNLRTRLRQHLDPRSGIRESLRESNIPERDVYVSMIAEGFQSTADGVNVIIEEIVQRLTNPPLTRRFG